MPAWCGPFIDAGGRGALLLALQVSRAENTSFLEAYLAATVKRYSASPQVLGFDVCNECYFTGQDRGPSLEALEDLVGAVKALAHPHKFTTTGMGDYGLWPAESEQIAWVDVVSFHSYNGNQSDFQRNVQLLKAKAKAAGKQVAFASEVMNRPWDPLCGDMDVLRAEGLGFFAWELMVSHSGWGVPKCDGCPLYQGILWPNGSAYNPEEVGCLRAAAAAPGSPPPVTWMPVGAGLGPSAGPSAAAPAAPAAIRFEPTATWRLESGGTKFLPWENQPWRGQSIASTGAPGATVSITPSGASEARAIVMYYSTLKGGGTLEVTDANRTTLGCVSFAASTPTHANRITVAAGSGAALAGATTLTVTSVSGAQILVAGFDVWTALPNGGLPPPLQPCRSPLR